jgi:hypothetical protein
VYNLLSCFEIVVFKLPPMKEPSMKMDELARQVFFDKNKYASVYQQKPRNKYLTCAFKLQD